MSAYISTHFSNTLGSLLELLRRACNGRYEFVPCYGVDYVGGRAQRTRKGMLSAALYSDGSGFEVAFLGRVFMLGVEAKSPMPE